MKKKREFKGKKRKLSLYSVLWGKSIILEKGGGVAKISIILIIYTPVSRIFFLNWHVLDYLLDSELDMDPDLLRNGSEDPDLYQN